MNADFIIIIGLFILTLLALVGSLYAVSLIKKRKYKAHIRIQNILFIAVTAGVIIFELQLRLSGGSGSLLGSSPVTNTSLFQGILMAHIMVTLQIGRASCREVGEIVFGWESVMNDRL